MKKAIIALLCIALLFVFTSCNAATPNWENDPVGVHILTHSGEDKCLRIKGWYEHHSGGLQVETEEYGELLLSQGTFILYDTICPICGAQMLENEEATYGNP